MPDPDEVLGTPDPTPRDDVDTDESMTATFIDSAHNMPGDQPEGDTPPSQTLADGTRTREQLEAREHPE